MSGCLKNTITLLNRHAALFQYDVFAQSGNGRVTARNQSRLARYLRGRAQLALGQGWDIPIYRAGQESGGFIRSWRSRYMQDAAIPAVEGFLEGFIPNAPHPFEVDPWDLLILSSDPEVHREIHRGGYADGEHVVIYSRVDENYMRVLLHLGPFQQAMFLQRFFPFTAEAQRDFYSWKGLQQSNLLTFEFSRLVVPESRLSLLAIRECRNFFYRTLREHHEGPVCLILQMKKDLRLIRFIFKGYEHRIFPLQNPDVVTVLVKTQDIA
jgi:hypothetical protein